MDEASLFVRALPNGHPIQILIADYGVMRADSRACSGETHTCIGNR